jgi:TP901 family phage tail tape measure protein
MATPPVIISVGGNAQGLYNEIVRQAKRAEEVIKRTPLRLETRNFGAIKGFTADIDRFDKSLTRMSAVIQTFGQSAAILFGVQNAMVKLVKTTIDVEKNMADLQVVLGGTNAEFEKLGKGLFDVAKITGQSFSAVSDAAKEFARQGLGVEETLKRTRDALILTRTTGLDVESSVQDLTATLNTFRKEALDSTKVINTFRNVDTKFAVSAADLAESLKRAGASANDAKVSFAELNALTASLQQTTARGGSVIGNSLKSIFTRVQRGDTIESLEEIGVAVKDAEGNIRPFVSIMQDLAFAIQNVSDVQKAQIKETVAGTYQINALSALLQDLSSEYSVYSQALSVANNTTNEAVKSNEQLNKTTAAILNETTQNITQLASKIGDVSIQPFIKNTLNAVNELFTSFQNLGEGSIGAQIGKGLLEGISSFLQGPGVAIFSAGLFKLSRLVFSGAAAQLKSVLTLSKENENILENQRRVASVLASQDPAIQKLIAGSKTRLELERNILSVINQETAALTFSNNLSRSVATSITKGRVGTRTAAGGYIPDMAAEKLAVMQGVGGAPSSAKPVVVPNFNMGGGRRGTIVANDSEYMVPNFAGGSAIFNRDMIEKFGLPKGARKIAAGGFIPNFANKLRFYRNKENTPNMGRMQLSESGSYLDLYANTDKTALNIDFMESFKKGDAFKLFNKAKTLGSRVGIRKIFSDEIVPQGYKFSKEELDSFASGDRLEALFKVFPQLKYRNQKGVKTSGLFVDNLMGGASKFSSIKGLAKKLQGISDADFRKMIGSNDLMALGQVTSRFAGGFIPNMAVIANTQKQKQFFNSLRGYAGSIDPAMALLGAIGSKPNIAIKQNLAGTLGPKAGAYGVYNSYNKTAELNRGALSGTSPAFASNVLLHELGHAAHYNLIDRSQFGGKNFSKKALQITSNLERAYQLGRTKSKYTGKEALGFGTGKLGYASKDYLPENVAQAFAEVFLPYKSIAGRNQGDINRNPLFRYVRRLTGKALGNFAGGHPLMESLQREAQSLEELGFPKGLIADSLRVQASSRLQNTQNPMGLGVFNTLQGQTSIGKALNDHKGENFYASGLVPNFASYRPLNTRFNAFGFGNQNLNRTVNQGTPFQFQMPVRRFSQIRRADLNSLTEYIETLAESAELVDKNRGRFTNAQNILEENVRRQSIVLAEVKRRSSAGDAGATRALSGLQTAYGKSLDLKDVQALQANQRRSQLEQEAIDRRDRRSRNVQSAFFAGSMALPLAGALGSSFIKNGDQRGAVNDFFSNAGLALTLGIGGGPVGLTAAGLGLGVATAKGVGDFRTAGLLGIEGRKSSLESAQASAGFNTQQFQAVQQLFTALSDAKIEGNAKTIQELFENLTKASNQIIDPDLQAASRAALGSGRAEDVQTQLGRALAEFQKTSNREIARRDVGLTVAELADKNKGFLGELQGITFNNLDQVKEFAGRIAASVDVSKLSSTQREGVSFLASSGAGTSSVLETLGLTELQEQIKQVNYVNQYWNETLGTTIAQIVSAQVRNEEYAKSMKDIAVGQASAISSAKTLSNTLKTLLFQRGSDTNFAFDKNIALAEEKLSQVSSPATRLLGENTIGRSKVNQATLNEISEVFSNTSDEILDKLKDRIGGKGPGISSIKEFAASQISGQNFQGLFQALSSIESKSEESKKLQRETVQALLQIKDRHDKEIQKLDEISKIRATQAATGAGGTLLQNLADPQTIGNVRTSLAKVLGGPQRTDLERLFNRSEGTPLFAGGSTPVRFGPPGTEQDKLNAIRARRQFSQNRLDLFDSISATGLRDFSDARSILGATSPEGRKAALDQIRSRNKSQTEALSPQIRDSILQRFFAASSGLVDTFMGSTNSRAFTSGLQKNPFEEIKKALELGNLDEVGKQFGLARSSISGNGSLTKEQRSGALDKLNELNSVLDQLLAPIKDKSSLDLLVKGEAARRVGGEVPEELGALIDLNDTSSQQLTALQGIQKTTGDIQNFLMGQMSRDLDVSGAAFEFNTLNAKVQEAQAKLDALNNDAPVVDERARIERIQGLIRGINGSQGFKDKVGSDFLGAISNPKFTGEKISNQFKEQFDYVSANFPKLAKEISGRRAVNDVFLNNGQIDSNAYGERRKLAQEQVASLRGPEFQKAQENLKFAQSESASFIKSLVQEVTSNPLKVDTANLESVVNSIKNIEQTITQKIDVSVSAPEGGGLSPDSLEKIRALIRSEIEMNQRRTTKINGTAPPIN